MGKKEEARQYGFKSVEYDGERIDCIAALIQDLRTDDLHVLVNALYQKFQHYARYSLDNKLFVQTWLYNHVIEYENSISSFYINDLKSGYDCCKIILTKKKADYRTRKSTLTNLLFYKGEIAKDAEHIQDLFVAADELLGEIYKLDECIESAHCEIWNILFDLYRPCLVKYNHSYVKYLKYKLGKRWDDDEAEIALTFTTCRRLDLFEQTMNSILNVWGDVDKIDLWFCVDDNSSEEDRAKMRELYPFMTFRFKTPEEKGHRQSMNLIYEYLRKRPNIKYWIHMEDDFLFHRNMNYVSVAKRALDDEQKQIHQICFNVNYAEKVDNYNTRGSERLQVKNDTKTFRVHVHHPPSENKKFGYANCHYWSHFTFRPSMILTSSIMETGNFDSPNTFFEMDYGKKWSGKHKFKTGFFDAITNRHIGRMTDERGNDAAPKNAYELNDECQFGKQDEVIKDENIVLEVSESSSSSSSSSKRTPFVKIINLKRRPDRKLNMISLLNNSLRWTEGKEYEFVEAVDGSKLEATAEIQHLFRYNDFGYRKAFIGCAMSHLQVWETFVAEEDDDDDDDKRKKGYLIILEDDIEQLHPAFLQVLEKFDNDGEFENRDMIYLSNSPCDYDDLTKGFSPDTSFRLQDLCIEKTIGGFFGYAVSKQGCRKLLENIHKNGIQHGIDYHVNMKCKEVLKYEIKPQLVFTRHVCAENASVDSDIQKDYDCFSFDDDILETDTLKIKMITNWCTSEELCNAYSAMCEVDYNYKNLEMVFHNDHDKIDYYVIINKPWKTGEVFDPKKTIVFQMEPWVYDDTKKWGVKTWGSEWAIPDETKFLKVVGRKTKGEYNNVEFNVGLNLRELRGLQYETKRDDELSTICSSKYFDEGHILRIDFLKFLDMSLKNFSMNIFGYDNVHNFESYKGTLSTKTKYKGMVPFKYYFMVENNFEEDYISEKLWEPILCECLVFYYGCPNVFDYVDSESFVFLDFSKMTFAQCFEVIKRAIEEDWWSLRLSNIKSMKKKILDEMAFFPRLRRMII